MGLFGFSQCLLQQPGARSNTKCMFSGPDYVTEVIIGLGVLVWWHGDFLFAFQLAGNEDEKTWEK